MTNDNDGASLEGEALYHAAQVADAALGAAEELGYPLAIAFGLCVYLKWDTWLGAIAVGVAAYFVAKYKYDKARDRAWTEYEATCGPGKHRAQ